MSSVSHSEFIAQYNKCGAYVDHFLRMYRGVIIGETDLSDLAEEDAAYWTDRDAELVREDIYGDSMHGAVTRDGEATDETFSCTYQCENCAGKIAVIGWDNHITQILNPDSCLTHPSETLNIYQYRQP